MASTTYRDEKQKCIVKNKFAYFYSLATGSSTGRSGFDQDIRGRRGFIDKLIAAGFERDPDDYQKSLQG